MPTLRQHDNRPVPQRTAEGSGSSCHNANNALDRNPPSLRFVMHQSLTTMVVQIAQLSKSDSIAWWRPAVCSWNVAINIKVTIVRQTIKLSPLLNNLFQRICKLWPKPILTRKESKYGKTKSIRSYSLRLLTSFFLYWSRMAPYLLSQNYGRTLVKTKKFQNK